MSDILPVSAMSGTNDACMLACQRSDPWSCCDLYSVWCRVSSVDDSSKKGTPQGVSGMETIKKEKMKMKPKKGKGKGC